MGLELVTPEYVKVLYLYEESMENGDIDGALKLALNNFPHKVEEVISIKLERFFNPKVREEFPPSVSDYEDMIELCVDFMPEAVDKIALNFYDFLLEENCYDEAVEVAALHIPSKLHEAVNANFNDLMKDKYYFDALQLKESFPDMIDYDDGLLARRAFESIMKDYGFYMRKKDDEGGITSFYRNACLNDLNYINNNHSVNGYIPVREQGTVVFHPLNLESRINKLQNSSARKAASK